MPRADGLPGRASAHCQYADLLCIFEPPALLKPLGLTPISEGAQVPQGLRFDLPGSSERAGSEKTISLLAEDVT